MVSSVHIYDDLFPTEARTSRRTTNLGYENVIFTTGGTNTDSHNVTDGINKSSQNSKRPLILFCGGLITGLFVASIVVFIAMKYGNNYSVDPSKQCAWTLWSSWTNCSASCFSGTQNRVKLQTSVSLEKCMETDVTDTRSCFSWHCRDDELRFDMTFDTSTLYSILYVSGDNRTLSTYSSTNTPNSPDGVNQLLKYQGTVANICLENNTKIYYEVTYKYEILQSLSERGLVLEVGVAEPDLIDNHHKASSKKVGGWSFALAECGTYDSICLWGRHLEDVYVKETVSNNTKGTNVNGKFAFYIDRTENIFSILWNSEIFYTFVGVNSNTTLCPVFAVYNNAWLNASLTIQNARNFTNLHPF